MGKVHVISVAMAEELTIGYWKIRGLAASLRMMCGYAGTPYVNKAYGEDAMQEWFGKDKPQLAEKNSLINLPYIIDGDLVVTQSNSCLVFLGQKLGIDKPEHAVRNHQALDQVMDLRNALMKVVYGGTDEGFPGAFTQHLEGAAKHFAKLEAFVKGPYVCGADPQSSDFHLFEMVDEHFDMVEQVEGVDFDWTPYPKLLALRDAMKKEPKLATSFSSEPYIAYCFNNAMYTRFKGAGFLAAGGVFGPTTQAVVKP